MMKKSMFIVACLLTVASQIFAENLFIKDFSIIVGETKEIDILLENNSAYVSFQFDLYLPEGLSITDYQKNGDRIPEGTSLSMAKMANGSYRFLAAAMSSEAIIGKNGSIVKLKVKAEEKFSGGDGFFKKAKLSHADGTGMRYEEMSSFNVSTQSTIIKGDANGDSKINVADITVIANYILGLSTASFVEDVADLNEDGKVNVADITCLANLILYGDIRGASAARTRAASNATASIPAMSIQRGESIQMPIHISSDTDFSAFQFDVALPDGIVLMDVVLADGQTHTGSLLFNYAEQKDGIWRILGANIDGSNFAAEGNIVMLTLKAEANAMSGNVEVSDLVLAKNGSSLLPSKAIALLSVGGTTAIGRILTDDKNATIYDMQGMSVKKEATADDLNRLPKGVYIINGKKISINK